MIKYSASFIIFFILAFYLSAQTDKKNLLLRHELGLNLFSINDFGRSELHDKGYQSYFLNGLMYKRHKEKYALRLGLDYHKIDYKSKSVIHRPNTLEGSRSLATVHMGLERPLSDSKLQPFIALDLIVTYYQDNPNQNGLSNYKYYEFGLGIAPTIGLRYQFLKFFSVSVETNVNIVLLTVNKYNDMEHIGEYADIAFNPLRLASINYHF